MTDKKRKRPKRQKVLVENKNLVNKMTHENICKYFRVTVYWAKRNYDISQAELDMLFFIYDIPFFTSDNFADYSKIVSFNYRKIELMIQRGWIVKWRKEGTNKKALFRISRKGKRLVTEFYKRLSGEAPFAESEVNNIVMRGKLSTDRIMANKMKEINAANRKKAAQVVWVRGDA